MNPTRRGFFGLFAAAGAAAIALDPERALWVPGKKLVSVPAPSRLFHTGWASGPGLKIGDTIQVRRPARFRARGGQQFHPEGITPGFDVFTVKGIAEPHADLVRSGLLKNLPFAKAVARDYARDFGA